MPGPCLAPWSLHAHDCCTLCRDVGAVVKIAELNQGLYRFPLLDDYYYLCCNEATGGMTFKGFVCVLRLYGILEKGKRLRARGMALAALSL